MFHLSLLEQDTTKKKQVEKNMTELEVSNIEKYKVETIRDSKVDAIELDGHLLGLYYLVSYKGYLEEKNIWEPLLPVQYLRNLINSFRKNYLEKLTTISLLIESALPMARLRARLIKRVTKQKQGRPANSISK